MSTIQLAKLSKANGKWRVIRGTDILGEFSDKDADKAMDLLNSENEKAAAAVETEAASTGPKLTVKNGKATISASGLGYKGQLFGGFADDFEAMFAFFGSPADSPARKAYDAIRSKLCQSWQAYGDLPVGATLPDGSTKPAPKGR